MAKKVAMKSSAVNRKSDDWMQRCVSKRLLVDGGHLFT